VKGAEVDGRAKIVMRTAVDISPTTPEEAALQLELVGHQAFRFANPETARAAALCRPHGGNRGLIDTAG
jgi:putative sigma-54 modulation protein